jgi:superoxide dismutase
MPPRGTSARSSNFQSLFTDAATKQFGSGWAVLVVNPAGHRLEIVSAKSVSKAPAEKKAADEK